MESIFPYLLSWGQLVPFILRLLGGIYFFYFGYKGLTSEWQHKLVFFRESGLKPYKLFAYALCVLELAGGVMLVMGFLTQLVALVFFVIAIIAFVLKRKSNATIQRDAHVYLLLAGIMLCLFIGGAGHFAMDLPI